MAEHEHYRPLEWLNCVRCGAAPERTESPTEGTAGRLLAAHERVWASGHYGGLGHYSCKSSDCSWIGFSVDAHRAHVAAVLDAHVTERCAETLEEAAKAVHARFEGGVLTHHESGRVAHWLRDRAAGMRGGERG